MINDTVNGGLQPKAPASASGPVLSAASISPDSTTGPGTPSRPAPPGNYAETAQPPQREALHQAVEELNDHARSMRRTLDFRIEESTGRTVISVYDTESEELIRQIPSKEAVRLASQLQVDSEVSLVDEQV